MDDREAHALAAQFEAISMRALQENETQWHARFEDLTAELLAARGRLLALTLIADHLLLGASTDDATKLTALLHIAEENWEPGLAGKEGFVAELHRLQALRPDVPT